MRKPPKFLMVLSDMLWKAAGILGGIFTSFLKSFLLVMLEAFDVLGAAIVPAVLIQLFIKIATKLGDISGFYGIAGLTFWHVLLFFIAVGLVTRCVLTTWHSVFVAYVEDAQKRYQNLLTEQSLAEERLKNKRNPL